MTQQPRSQRKITFPFIMGWFWTLVIISLLGYIFIFDPQLLSPEYMAEQLAPYQEKMGWIYAGLLLGRGVLMLPSTPFLFLGLVLFPDFSFLVVLGTMLSVLLSATFFYYFSEQMGWHLYFERKFPKRMRYVEGQLQRPRALWIVMFWSFLPISPTDLICYVAGMVKMPFRYLFLGVLIGQFPLMLIYAYLLKLF